MSATRVEEIANAVLYEGYMLYPYRPSSLKNRRRWNFGVVYPKPYSETQSGSDNWFMQTECLATGEGAHLGVRVRFLQAVARTIGWPKLPLDEWPSGRGGVAEQDLEIVPTLQVGDQILQAWEEAIEREMILPDFLLSDACPETYSSLIRYPAENHFEPVRGSNGRIAALIIRTQKSLCAQVQVARTRLQGNLFKVTVCIKNATTTDSLSIGCSEALMQSLLSAHAILRIESGEFVSLLDPPAPFKEFVSECHNLGTWPVLAGEQGQRNTMLSSPVILYDYPQIAPESAGDFFDGTEIDEILALRILTLTDDEKREMRNSDERAREILERTESMPEEHFMKLHGVLRGLRPADGEEKS